MSIPNIQHGLRLVWENTPSLVAIIPVSAVYTNEVAYNENNCPYAIIQELGEVGALRDSDGNHRRLMYRIVAYTAQPAQQHALSEALYDLENSRFDTDVGKVLSLKVAAPRASRDNNGVRNLSVNVTVGVGRPSPSVRTIIGE